MAPHAKFESEEEPPDYNAIDEPPLTIPPLNLSVNAGLAVDTTVTQDECVAHLKFLATLADLRETVASTTDLFGIPDPIPEIFEENLSEAAARVKEKRWALYTTRAAERYKVWWDTCIPSSRPRLRLDDFEKVDYENLAFIERDAPLYWTPRQMPPLDILMVWHAHMLNPRAFLEDCLRQGKTSFWATGFPWQVINNCIDDRDLAYNLDQAAKENFYTQTGLQWDNLQEKSEKSVVCPSCEVPFSVPWTEGEPSILPGETWEDWHGFADKQFKATCPACGFDVNHEKLKISKFRNDIKALLSSTLPMPGTLYNLRGVPEAFTYQYRRKVQSSFPNRLIQATGIDLLRWTDPKQSQCITTVVKLRDLLESKMKSRSTMREVNTSSFQTTLLPMEKVAFRRMMSRYWENVGPFALDLVGAVIRQGTFIQKMDNIDWLHSPTVKETMTRLIQKYVIFFHIMASNPRHMAVPTLDVDLAWHTHQLCPSRYYAYSTYMTRTNCRLQIFIDHDDKVEEGKLSDGFEWTSKMYKKLTDGEVYSECTCWYCEAIRTSDLFHSRLLVSSSTARARKAANNLHDRPDISSNPDENPHISAHNAVRGDQTSLRDARYVKFLKLRSEYDKSQRRAAKQDGKKKGDSQASTDSGLYAYPLVWGYPMYVPYYGPYMCDPGVNSDSYACNPACMSLAIGAHDIMDKLKGGVDSASKSAKEQVSNTYDAINNKTGGSGSKAGEVLSKGKDQADSMVDSAKQKVQGAMGQKSE
ncbi:hypothetical protein FE257_002373 [Aspergillus nanangensis]|uniref:Alpha-ketoglutarate-dependent sulfonate dioxygenase n=1 Tax=Aspergillus nanangensis TaxID=2582783 RepID=A0AAD4GP32_ASPNN|nr:hypothetical protein FE257_002373 [Aspergillus nanangensis]